MIRTALIYATIDKCLDIVFGNIDSILKHPRRNIKPGETFHRVILRDGDGLVHILHYVEVTSLIRGGTKAWLQYRSGFHSGKDGKYRHMKHSNDGYKILIYTDHIENIIK